MTVLPVIASRSVLGECTRLSVGLAVKCERRELRRTATSYEYKTPGDDVAAVLQGPCAVSNRTDY